MATSQLSTCALCGQGELLAVASGLPVQDAAERAHESIAYFLSHLLDASAYPARWHCGQWTAEVGWLHILSDVAIFLAYMAIPASLLIFIRRRKDVPLRGIFWLFAAFICSCGLTHLADATMFYFPAYRLLGVMKLVTAVVSTATVLALVRAMPAALGLPGRLRDSESELARRKKAEAAVLELNRKLQERNSALTVRSKRIDQAMELGRIGVMRWTARTGDVEWEVGVRDAMRDEQGRMPSLTCWADVLDTRELAAMLETSMEAARDGRPIALEVPLSRTIATGLRIRVSGAAEPGSDPANPVIVGFARVLDTRVAEQRIG